VGVRSPILVSILVALTTGACSQSLTPNPGGTGGLGGSVAPVCADLGAKYEAALTAGETCQVGASGQCQQLVNARLDAVCACPVLVTDDSALTSITQAFLAADCERASPPCGAVDCPPLNTTCVPVDGGSLGFCSYAPSVGTGGSSGAGGSGGSPVDGGLGAPEAILYPSPYNAGADMLELSNVPLSCQNTMPTEPCTPAGVAYTVSIQIPPADLVPGVYLLNSLIYPSFSETGPNTGLPTECWGGGGTFNDGSLEILAVSSTELVFQLQGTYSGNFDVNGTTITAQRCAGAMQPASTP
jgi:hypothetical protein